MAKWRFPGICIEGRWVSTNIDYRPVIWGKTLGRCIYCDVKLNNRTPHKSHNPHGFTVDHFIPRDLGGRSFLWNLVPSCYTCNNRKWNTHPKRWLPRNKYERLCEELGIQEMV